MSLINFPNGQSGINCSQCGCMLTRKAMQIRIKQAKFANIPIVNYELTISYMHGTLSRTLEPFPDVKHLWQLFQKEMLLL